MMHEQNFVWKKSLLPENLKTFIKASSIVMLPYSFFSFAFYCNWFPQTCGFWVFSSCLDNYISPSQNSQYIKFAAHKIFIQALFELEWVLRYAIFTFAACFATQQGFRGIWMVLWEKTVFPDLNFFLIKRVMYKTIR